MTPNLENLAALAIVAVFAGTLFRGEHRLGDGSNFLLGLTGAILGGWVFTLLKVDLQLGLVQISVGDAAEALLGALVLVGLVALSRQQRRNREASEA